MTQPVTHPTPAAKPCAAPSWSAASKAAEAFVPATVLIGITGTVIAQGHDALALSLGLAGAAFLWATSSVRYWNAHGRGLPGDLARRYDSPLLGATATAILAGAFVFLLTAELTALSGAMAAAAPGLGVPPLVAVTILTLASGVLEFTAARLSKAPHIALAIPAVIVALLVSLAALSGHDGLGVLVSVQTLADIGVTERALLDKRLADPSVFKPFASPFLRTDVLNTLAAIACISLGMAILAAARRGRPVGADSAHTVRPRAMACAIAALVLIPALAAAGRRALLTAVDGGVKATALPDWMASLAKGTALQICGTAQAADAAAIVKACGKGVGPQGLMRWQDFSFVHDSMLMSALASQAGTTLAPVAGGLVLVAALLAAMASSRAAALSLFVTNTGDEPDPGAVLAITAMSWLVAAGFTAMNPAPSATLLVWAATLAAAGLAPALMMASLASSPSRGAALVAMPLGAALTLGLILVTRFNSIDTLAFTAANTPLSPPAMRKVSTLFVQLGNAQGDAARAAVMAQLQDLARENISWLGLKPLAAGAWGLVIGACVMVAGQALSTIARLTKRN